MSDFLSRVIAGGDIQRLFPPVSFGAPGDAKLFATHATTIVGVCAKDAAVVCADTQATNTQKLDRYREPVSKLTIAGEYGVVGIAGAPGPGLKSTRLFQVAVSAEQCLTGGMVSVEKYGLMLQDIATQLFPLVMSTGGELAVAFLLGCYDLESRTGRVVTIDPTGFLLEHKETGYVAIGSGADPAQDWLDENYRGRASASTAQEALRAGIGALRKAAERNAGTGEPFCAVILNKDGARTVPHGEIDAVLNDIRGGVHGR
ncbi:MAG: hypothetical protein HY475_02145 [Candidatus Terrybacteria bacterium]|nr:hypothetical protein [Candidatus Terrybacteria bacterium]